MKPINSIPKILAKGISNRFLLAFVALFFVASFQSKSYAQCSESQVKEYVAYLVKHLPKDKRTGKPARFLKQYKLDKSSPRKRKNSKTSKYYIESRYVCSKNTTYYLTLKAATNPDVKIEVLTSSKRLIVSNYRSGKYLKGVGFVCKASGQYILRFTFNGRTSCAAAVLSFLR